MEARGARRSSSWRHAGRAAVFLDKDGTLVQDLPYNVDPSRMKLAPGALRGACELAADGFPLVVIGHAPGVALGLHDEAALDPIRNWVRETFAAYGVEIAGMYWCPHHPHGIVREYARVCECRKPKPGLLLRAARDLGISLAESWFIGDVLDDIEAGHRAGCRTILIDNGNETQWRRSTLRTPDYTAATMGSAADRIVAITQDASRRAVAHGG